MTVHLPAVIDPHGVGPIIAAVRNAFVHKPVPINPKLDPAALASDIRRAILRYNILRDMQKGEWNKRVRCGRRLLRVIAPKEVEVLLHQDDPGRWWKKALITTAKQEEFAAWRGSLLPWGVETAEEVAAFHDRVRYLLKDRFVSKGDPRSARAVLGEGSALEWLIRRRPADLTAEESFCLPTIFERHFGLKAGINTAHRTIHGVPTRYVSSPYLAFVIAVLIANEIPATKGNICTTFHRRQRTRRP